MALTFDYTTVANIKNFDDEMHKSTSQFAWVMSAIRMNEINANNVDEIVFRLKFAPTVFAARQLVSHGHVMVNGKVVDRKSYQIKDGDEISLQQNSQNIPMIIQTLSSNERDVPEYLQLEISKCLGKFVRGPQLTDVPYPVQMEPNLVVEFYSR